MCNFLGADVDQPGFGLSGTGFGYHMPVTFNFSASGGTGVYSWSNEQIFIISGFIQYVGNPRPSPVYIIGAEELNWGPAVDGVVPPPPVGPTATPWDAPGLSRRTPSGTVYQALVHFSFELMVSVSSGGQTVECPDVFWDANLAWNTINGRPVATGVVTVDTQPTQ
jgi:hypothetical protein